MAARFDTLKVRLEFSIIFYPLGVLVAVGKARFGEINEVRPQCPTIYSASLMSNNLDPLFKRYSAVNNSKEGLTSRRNWSRIGKFSVILDKWRDFSM